MKSERLYADGATLPEEFKRRPYGTAPIPLLADMPFLVRLGAFTDGAQDQCDQGGNPSPSRRLTPTLLVLLLYIL